MTTTKQKSKYTLTMKGCYKIAEDLNGLNGFVGGAEAHIKVIHRLNVTTTTPKGVKTKKRFCVELADGVKIYNLEQWRDYFNPTHKGLISQLHK